jgi:GNAT superfamily N-acetyltransferase
MLAFDAVHALYAQTIELSEQKTEAEIRAAFANSLYCFLVAEEAGVIVGFSILYLPLAADFWVLEYLAVAPSHEGQGLGGRLFAESAAVAEGRVGLVEVDSDSGEDAGSAKRRRRLGFYAHAGCRRLGDISYVLPLRANGTPPPMEILVHAPEAFTSVPAVTTRDWLTRLYVEVYGQPADDPRIDLMLTGQSGDVPFKPIGSGRAPATP